MTEMSKFARDVMEQKYAQPGETWADISRRVATNVMNAVQAPSNLIQGVLNLIEKRKFMPGGRYLYAAGRPYHQTQNCLLLRVEDSREGWGKLLDRASRALMSGAGVGVDYSLLRGRGSLIQKTGGTATGPNALMQMMNEVGRGIMQGGNRRSALWAGLKWNHSDIMEFISLKNWSVEVRALKEKNFDFPATMDGTNISVILDDEFFKAYEQSSHRNHELARSIYWTTIKRMLKTGEPGFSVDIGPNIGESLRNACTEITSSDDNDICNLGSINMARIETLSEMHEAVELGTAFLLAGTVYSDVPYPEVEVTRKKNRRLGLGLMGLHEWLLKKGKKYEPDADLEEYLEIYAQSDQHAVQLANTWGLSIPIKTRAIAPNGTIGIVAETTASAEPLTCVALKRRYIKNNTTHYQYVIDPCAKRLIEKGGLDPDSIEDAYSLAADVERRVTFQTWIQQYVDHGISSTINLPAWGTDLNNESKIRSFGNMLLKYLPKLRGLTVYPDGARSGQPITKVKYSTAINHVGQVFVEQTDICDVTRSGSCGT